MHLNANHFLGYDKDEKGNLVINEAQAAIVRRVFDEFMNGPNPETARCIQGIDVLRQVRSSLKECYILGDLWALAGNMSNEKIPQSP